MKLSYNPDFLGMCSLLGTVLLPLFCYSTRPGLRGRSLVKFVHLLWEIQWDDLKSLLLPVEFQDADCDQGFLCMVHFIWESWSIPKVPRLSVPSSFQEEPTAPLGSLFFGKLSVKQADSTHLTGSHKVALTLSESFQAQIQQVTHFWEYSLVWN